MSPARPVFNFKAIKFGAFFAYFYHFRYLKVARNEVKNSSLAQRSAHREVKNMATGIDRTGRRGQAICARADYDGRSNQPTPTHRVCHSAIFHPITPIMFGFSESADIGLTF